MHDEKRVYTGVREEHNDGSIIHNVYTMCQYIRAHNIHAPL